MNRTGSLNLLVIGVDANTGQRTYAITFAPYDRRGGALPARKAHSDEDLILFLTEIGMDQLARQPTLSRLTESGRVAIPNVTLSDEQLAKYGLRELGILQSILTYLSTST